MDDREKARLKNELRAIQAQKEKAVLKDRNVNMRLLAIIIALLVCMAVAVFYASIRYDEVARERSSYSKQKNTVNELVAECEASLKKKGDELNMLIEELNMSSATRTSLNELYSDLSDTKSKLEANLSKTESTLLSCEDDVAECEDEKETLEVKVEDYKDAYTKITRDLVSANKEIDDLETDLSAIRDQLADLQDEYDDLVSCVEDNNCTACD